MYEHLSSNVKIRLFLPSRGRALFGCVFCLRISGLDRFQTGAKRDPGTDILAGDAGEKDWSWRESNPHLRDATAAHSHYATAPKHSQTGFEGGILPETVGKSTLYLRFFHLPSKTG